MSRPDEPATTEWIEFEKQKPPEGCECLIKFRVGLVSDRMQFAAVRWIGGEFEAQRGYLASIPADNVELWAAIK